MLLFLSHCQQQKKWPAEFPVTLVAGSWNSGLATSQEMLKPLTDKKEKTHKFNGQKYDRGVWGHATAIAKVLQDRSEMEK